MDGHMSLGMGSTVLQVYLEIPDTATTSLI